MKNERDALLDKIEKLARKTGGWKPLKDHYLTMTSIPLGVNTSVDIEEFKKDVTKQRYGFEFTYLDIADAEKRENERTKRAAKRRRYLKPAKSD